MGLKITNPKIYGEKGTFMRIRGNPENDHQIEVDNLYMEGKEVTGFDISNQNSLIEFLGLPSDTDPKDVINLLAQIQGKTPAESAEIIKKSALLERLGGVSNVISITANLAALTLNPNVQQMIASLSS